MDLIRGRVLAGDCAVKDDAISNQNLHSAEASVP